MSCSEHCNFVNNITWCNGEAVSGNLRAACAAVHPIWSSSSFKSQFKMFNFFAVVYSQKLMQKICLFLFSVVLHHYCLAGVDVNGDNAQFVRHINLSHLS